MYAIRSFTPALPEIERLFDDMLCRTQAAATAAEFAPVIDVSEDEDAFIVRTEIAGVVPTDVEVSVEDGVLTIRGEKKVEEASKEGRLHRTERRYGRFVRSVQFPTPLDADQVSATHKHGVLTVRLPKHAKAKARTVKIEVAE